jgi:hypothetical protein
MGGAFGANPPPRAVARFQGLGFEAPARFELGAHRERSIAPGRSLRVLRIATPERASRVVAPDMRRSEWDRGDGPAAFVTPRGRKGTAVIRVVVAEYLAPAGARMILAADRLSSQGAVTCPDCTEREAIACRCLDPDAMRIDVLA